jgi:hypothetical protein
MVNVNMPLYIWQGAIGFQLYNESLGAESQNCFAASYNYILQSNTGPIFHGASRRNLSEVPGWNQASRPDGTYEGSVIDHQDIHLPNGKSVG